MRKLTQVTSVAILAAVFALASVNADAQNVNPAALQSTAKQAKDAAALLAEQQTLNPLAARFVKKLQDPKFAARVQALADNKDAKGLEALLKKEIPMPLGVTVEVEELSAGSLQGIISWVTKNCRAYVKFAKGGVEAGVRCSI